jgi:ParB-like chromosome segregation protein Spo0J
MDATTKQYAETPGVEPRLIDNLKTVTRRIPLLLLSEPPDAMRHNMDDNMMGELMESIRTVGLLENLGVVPINPEGRRVEVAPMQAHLEAHEKAGGSYQVRFGHRRLLAMRGLNMVFAECKVFCSFATSDQAIMAHENGFREEPSDYDLAVLYSRWMKEPGITETELRKRAGKSLDFIYARAEILEGWEPVAMALHEMKIPFTVARALNREVDEPFMLMFLKMAIDQGATGKLVSAWVTEHKAHKDMAAPAQPVAAGGSFIQTHYAPPPECLLCGDKASYNLQTVMMCHDDVVRCRDAREQVEAQRADSEPKP